MCDRPLSGCSNRACRQGPEGCLAGSKRSGTEGRSMLYLRSFGDISGLDAGWLQAKHHFAIGPYGNPAHKAVGNLIVLNDDEIAPHTGFALHHHANIEIVTYVHDGTITHRDDQGNVGTIRGLLHSERNDDDSPARLFQIWFRPKYQVAYRSGRISRFRRPTGLAASS